MRMPCRVRARRCDDAPGPRISVQTNQWWGNQECGVKPEEAKRLKQFEEENRWLKQIGSHQSLGLDTEARQFG